MQRLVLASKHTMFGSSAPRPSRLRTCLALICLASCAPEAGPSPRPSTRAEPSSRPVDTSPSPDCSPSAPNSDGTPKRARPGPPNRPFETLVLDAEDFGPQASSFSLIGMQWWSWEGGGSWEPCDSFDVRVVVYRGLSLETVKLRGTSNRCATT
jgi:hypothetical protein